MEPEVNEQDEIQIESRTQSAETIAAVLEGEDYAVTGTVTATDDGEKPVVEAEPEAESEAEPEPEAETGEETPEPGEEAQLKKHKYTTAQRNKFKQQRLYEENAELKRKLTEFEAGKPAELKPVEVKSDPAQAEEAKLRPNPDDFDEGLFDPAYQDAMVDWRIDERDRVKRVKESEAQAQQAKERQSEQEQAAVTSWNEKVEACKTAHEDYDEVMTGAKDMPVSFPVLAAAKDGAMPAEVMYWLATNPDESKRIYDATLITDKDSPRQAARKQALAVEEIEKIEAELSGSVKQPVQAAGAQKKIPVPTKPTPVDPVGARSGNGRKPLSQYTQDELRALDSLEYTKLYKAEYGRNPY